MRKMSGGGKSCSQGCLRGKLLVSNIVMAWKIPCGGKYLAVEIFWLSKQCQEVTKTLPRLQPIQLLSLFVVKKYLNKRHEYIL